MRTLNQILWTTAAPVHCTLPTNGSKKKGPCVDRLPSSLVKAARFQVKIEEAALTSKGALEAEGRPQREERGPTKHLGTNFLNKETST